MKSIFLIYPVFLFYALVGISQVSEQFLMYDTIKQRMVSRHYLVSVPTVAAPNGGYPVVIVLHGTGDSARQAYVWYGWRLLGLRDSFIVVYPDSKAYLIQGDTGCIVKTKWNTGDLLLEACDSSSPKFDDVQFIKNMIDTLKQDYSVNQNKIFLTGFSSGSVMANKLAMEVGYLFKAVASHAGTLYPTDTVRFAGVYVPTWQTLGNKDAYIPTLMNLVGIPKDTIEWIKDTLRNDGALLSKLFLTKYQLSSSFISPLTNLNTIYTLRFSTPLAGSPYNNQFRFSFIRSCIHIYPNGINHSISLASEYWNYFKSLTP